MLLVRKKKMRKETKNLPGRESLKNWLRRKKNSWIKLVLECIFRSIEGKV